MKIYVFFCRNTYNKIKTKKIKKMTSRYINTKIIINNKIYNKFFLKKKHKTQRKNRIKKIKFLLYLN